MSRPPADEAEWLRWVDQRAEYRQQEIDEEEAAREEAEDRVDREAKEDL